MRRLTTTTSTLAACAVLLAGCSSGGGDATGQLQADLDAQARAQDALRERIGELEERLAAATAPDTEDPTAALSDRIDEVSTTIADLTRQLDAATTTHEDDQAETLASLTALDAGISELRSQLDELRTELTKLREDHELLKRRFDNHTHS